MNPQRASGSSTPMHYASAYAPPVDPHACPVDPVECPLPTGSVNDGPYCDDSEQHRELENLQADMQRHVNDIKGAHLRWLPGRFRSARRDMLQIACVAGEDNLPKQEVLAPVWPPVPRSKDLAHQRRYLDVHGHVLALKLWAKAVLFAVRYDKSMSVEQKRSLCRATERTADDALHACKQVSRYDRWRLSLVKKHLTDIRHRLTRKK